MRKLQLQSEHNKDLILEKDYGGPFHNFRWERDKKDMVFGFTIDADNENNPYDKNIDLHFYFYNPFPPTRLRVNRDGTNGRMQIYNTYITNKTRGPEEYRKNWRKLMGGIDVKLFYPPVARAVIEYFKKKMHPKSQSMLFFGGDDDLNMDNGGFFQTVEEMSGGEFLKVKSSIGKYVLLRREIWEKFVEKKNQE